MTGQFSSGADDNLSNCKHMKSSHVYYFFHLCFYFFIFFWGGVKGQIGITLQFCIRNSHSTHNGTFSTIYVICISLFLNPNGIIMTTEQRNECLKIYFMLIIELVLAEHMKIH